MMLSNQVPMVSIVLITYNRASLLGESIQSIIDQTYQNWELIIVDDGSTDTTHTVVQSLADERIQYHWYARSGKLGLVRNLGIKLAKGKLVAFQDSDDLWTRDKLQIQVDHFDKHPEIKYALCSNGQFGENAADPPIYAAPIIGKLFLSLLLKKQFHFCATSLIFRKEMVTAVGLLEENLPRMRELQFFFRMSYRYEGIFMNERLVNVRRHESNTSSSYRQAAHNTMISMMEDFYAKELLTKAQYRKVVSQYLYTSGLDYQQANQTGEALNVFRRIISIRPLHAKAWIRLAQCKFIK